MPRKLRLVFRTALSTPERKRRFLARVTRTERAFLAMDQATRDAYHARATGGGSSQGPQLLARDHPNRLSGRASEVDSGGTADR